MGDRFDLRWLLRAECLAIVNTVHSTTTGAIHVFRCHRRRFHFGACSFTRRPRLIGRKTS